MNWTKRVVWIDMNELNDANALNGLNELDELNGFWTEMNGLNWMNSL